MASFTIHVDENIIDRALRRRFEAISDSATMLAMHNTLARYCDPYVPFLNGPLSQTNIVTAENVTYIQPYARYQYYGVGFKHTTDYHPLASAMWDRAMLRDRGQEFNEELRDIILLRLQQLQ